MGSRYSGGDVIRQVPGDEIVVCGSKDTWDVNFRSVAESPEDSTRSVLGSSRGSPPASAAAPGKKRRAILISSPLPRKTSRHVNSVAKGPPSNCTMEKPGIELNGPERGCQMIAKSEIKTSELCSDAGGLCRPGFR